MALEVDIQLMLKDYLLHVTFHTTARCMGILGPSGSGKSMTLKAIAGVVKPDKGRIVYNGTVFFDSKKGIHLPPQKRNVGYVFQKYALFPNMTVYQNIASGLGKLNGEKKERIELILRQFHIEGLKDSYPMNLSGGEQQRTALARTLIYQPSLLLFDEPFSALDTYLKEELQLELLKLLDEHCGQAVMVSHDQDELYRICDELTVMSEGMIVIKKETKALFTHPEKIIAARISGCKNIVEAKKIDMNSIKIKEWNITLKTRKIHTDVKAVGIRAHSFYEIGENEFADNINCRNCFPATIVKIVDSLFETNLLLKTEGGVKEIWWKKPKDKDYRLWDVLYISVCPEDILLLDE